MTRRPDSGIVVSLEISGIVVSLEISGRSIYWNQLDSGRLASEKTEEHALRRELTAALLKIRRVTELRYVEGFRLPTSLARPAGLEKI